MARTNLSSCEFPDHTSYLTAASRTANLPERNFLVEKAASLRDARYQSRSRLTPQALRIAQI
jgi:hypothetical protein